MSVNGNQVAPNRVSIFLLPPNNYVLNTDVAWSGRCRISASVVDSEPTVRVRAWIHPRSLMVYIVSLSTGDGEDDSTYVNGCIVTDLHHYHLFVVICNILPSSSTSSRKSVASDSPVSVVVGHKNAIPTAHRQVKYRCDDEEQMTENQVDSILTSIQQLNVFGACAQPCL